MLTLLIELTSYQITASRFHAFIIGTKIISRQHLQKEGTGYRNLKHQEAKGSLRKLPDIGEENIFPSTCRLGACDKRQITKEAYKRSYCKFFTVQEPSQRSEDLDLVGKPECFYPRFAESHDENGIGQSLWAKPRKLVYLRKACSFRFFSVSFALRDKMLFSSKIREGSSRIRAL